MTHTIFGVHDTATIDQFLDAMREPYVVMGALMPDGHVGYSLPIGAVIATKDVVVPAWVGYDIGCGVLALRTGWSKHNLVDGADCQQILAGIYSAVPVGFSHNEVPTQWISGNFIQHFKSSWMQEYTSANCINKQIGTLGSGNHFIEIGYDDDGDVWIVVHSGSRNFGHQVATHYMRIASGDGKAREGNFPLHKGTQDFSNYMTDQRYTLEFALENRMEIARRVFDVMCTTLGEGTANWDSLINRNHNHVEYDPTFGVYIHRKGATQADELDMGVVPGNMRDGSVIVRGLGNPASLFSSSHGAGRCMSRTQARKAISIEELTRDMRGITCTVSESILDEGPEAYKQFDDILRYQKDLIEVVYTIRPIINVKGGK